MCFLSYLPFFLPQLSLITLKMGIEHVLGAVLDRLPRGSQRLIRPALAEEDGSLVAISSSRAPLRRRGVGVVEVGKKKKFEIPKVDLTGGPSLQEILAKRPIAAFRFAAKGGGGEGGERKEASRVCFP